MENEREVLIFKIEDRHFAISVDTVQEIMAMQKVTGVPNTISTIEGICMPRDEIITIVNLRELFNIKGSKKEGILIVTNYNDMYIALHVDEAEKIHRIENDDFRPADNIIKSTKYGSAIIGSTKINDDIILMIDIDKIINDIAPELLVVKENRKEIA